MSIQLLIKLSLLITLISGYQAFLEIEENTQAYKISEISPPTFSVCSYAKITSVTSAFLDLNYKLLSKNYQQFSEALNELEKIASAYQSGQLSEENFLTALLLFIPQSLSNELTKSTPDKIYTMAVLAYSGYVNSVLNLIKQVDS